MKKYLLLLFCIASAFAVSASEKNNLTAKFDPGFEQGTQFWYFFRKKLGGSFAKGKGINNSRALVFKSDTKLAEAVVYRKGFVPVKPGQIYTLEAKYKSNIKRGYADMRTHFWSGAVNNNQGKGSKCEQAINNKITASTDGRWSVVRHTFKVPENINGVHIGFAATGLLGEVIFDDVKIFQVTGKNEIPLISQAPALNGKVDPDFIKKAAKLTDFIMYPASKHKNKMAPDQTEAYLAMTTDELCGQVLLFHSKKYPIKKVAAKNDTLKVFGSDCIEFFITYTGREAPYYQICINSSGNVYDSLGMAGLTWSSGIKTAVGKVNDSCYLIAFSIPLKNIGYNHVLDKGLIIPSWRLNFGRNHAAAAKSYSSSWKALSGGFHDIHLFDWFVGMGTREGAVYSDRFHFNDLVKSKAKEQQQAFWPIKNKEYESLFSNKYSPFKGKAAFIWSQPLGNNMMDFAIQYGIEYSKDLMFKEYAKADLMPYVSEEGMRSLDDSYRRYIKKTKNGIVLYFPNYGLNYEFTSVYNPAVLKRSYDWTRKTLKENPGLFWGVSLGDEATEVLIRHFINHANDPERMKKDPLLRAAVKEVREKYGYGKYGVPSSPKAKERFQWIATKKYVFDKVLAMQKELYKICQEFKGSDGKNLVCFSSDPIDGLNVLQNQSREKDHCDIFTAQCLPHLSSVTQTVAFTTKMLKDMTGKEVWPCVHFEPYYYSHDSETTAAYLSEVARGGGTGIQIWNSDYVGIVNKMGCSMIDYYGHRPRWDTMLDIVNRFRTMPLLKYPEPEFAYYLSNETVNSYWSPLFKDCEALFYLLGPTSGSWFKFICGNQLLDKDVDLKKWKAVFISRADIELPENQKKFLDYVKNGGTLICFDPKVFSYASDGSSTAAFREQIFGAKTIASSEVLFKFVNHPYTAKLTKELISMTPGSALKPFGNTEVLAKFMNNTAAVTMKKYPGGGKAILFASTMKNTYVAQKEWQDMIKQIVQTEGFKTDHKIWNFSFPYKKAVRPVIKEKCYTNNYFFWWRNEPDTSANVKLPGAYYSYSVAPDDTAEKTFSFAKGRLTNRIFALTAGDLANRRNRSLVSKGKLSRAMFADTWIDEDTINIHFNLKKKVPLTKIVIYYTGSLPGVTVKLANGKTYSATGKTSRNLERLEIKVPATLSDTVDLIVAQRSLGEKLTISEVEIFGNPIIKGVKK